MGVRVLALTIVVGLLAAPTAGRTQARGLSLPDLPHPKIADAPEIGRYGGTLVFVQTVDPRTFNPLAVSDGQTRRIVAPLFSGLVERNHVTGQIEPGLAEQWTVSPNGRTWTFVLREGLRWSDGVPLTADDVVFTAQANFTVYPVTPAFIGGRIRVQKLDSRRVQFLTPRRIGPFLSLIAYSILPRHKLADALARGGRAFTATWGVNTPAREIVGSGPFVLQSYVPGQRVIYLRNPHFWQVDRKGNRLPYLTRLVRLISGEIPTTLRFQAGELDVLGAGAGAAAEEFAGFKRGEAAGNFTVYDGPVRLDSVALVSNQNPAGVSPPRLAWFRDVRFRRALNHAIDRQTIIQQVYAERAVPGWGPVSPGDPVYYNPGVPQYPYDLGRAQQLLEAAGYARGTDGVLRDPQGNAVEFTLATAAHWTAARGMITILRQDFTRLGIRVTLAPEALGILVDQLDKTYKWDTVLIDVSGGGLDPALAYEGWTSSSPWNMWYPRQTHPSTAWEEDLDRIFASALGELDEGKRRQLFNRWQEIVASQLPVTIILHEKTYAVVRNTIGNVQVGVQGEIGKLQTIYYRTPYR